MKITELLEGGDWEVDVADKLKAKFAKMKSDAPKSQSTRPAPKDPHPDKSMIWKKGFADGKAGRMDPKASDAYGPKIGEYEAGYAAGSKMKESVSEMTSGSVASSMGNGNGFVGGGPGTISRTGTKKKRKSKKK